jgi:hypothetical protein
MSFALCISHHQNQQIHHQEHALCHKTNQQLKHSMTNEELKKPTLFINTTATTNNKEQTIDDQADSVITIPGPNHTSTSSTANATLTITTPHLTVNEKILSLYDTWTLWNTDTDNNADEFNLVPLSLRLMIVSSDDETGDRIGDSDRSPELTFCDKHLQIGSEMVVDDGDVMNLIEKYSDVVDGLFVYFGDSLMKTAMDL